MDAAVGATTLPPKLIGSYEVELHPLWDRVLMKAPEVVINIGSAEGYYAVGLAMRLPEADVHAFDIDPAARWLCGALAQQNNVADRVHVRRDARAAVLDRLMIGKRALVVCDCEGCEATVLDPLALPSLKLATVLVEFHEFMVPGVRDLVMARFELTHAITIVEATERRVGDYLDQLHGMPEQDAVTALDEFRPEGMTWALMEPRTTDVRAAAPSRSVARV